MHKLYVCIYVNILYIYYIISFFAPTNTEITLPPPIQPYFCHHKSSNVSEQPHPSPSSESPSPKSPLQTPKSHFLLRYNPIFAITKAQMSVNNPIQVPLRSHPHPNHQILSRIPKHSTFDDTSAITQLCVAVLSKMLRGKAFKQHTATTSPSNLQHLGRTVITSTLKKSNPPKKIGSHLGRS